MPLIFAVPVLVWAGLLYLALQPMPGTGAKATAGDIFIGPSTTFPVFSTTKVETVPPLVPPVYPTPIPCSNAAAITEFHATVTVEQANVVIRVRDQKGRLVSCAWALPKGGNHAVGGETDTTGTVVYPLADLPADDYFYGVVEMKGTTATAAYSFTR